MSSISILSMEKHTFCLFNPNPYLCLDLLSGLWNGRLIMHQQDVCHPFLSIPIYIFLLFHCILYYRFILVYIRSKNRPFLLIYRDAIDTMVEYIFTERFSFQVEYINILSTIHLDAFPCILGYFFKWHCPSLAHR